MCSPEVLAELAKLGLEPDEAVDLHGVLMARKRSALGPLVGAVANCFVCRDMAFSACADGVCADVVEVALDRGLDGAFSQAFITSKRITQ